MKYGYARVSTDDQNPALQLAALKRAGCKTMFKDEGLSGATTKRPALSRCLKALRPGDVLVVWKLDRLGRSLRDLITMLDGLRDRQVKFQSLTEAIDVSNGPPSHRALAGHARGVAYGAQTCTVAHLVANHVSYFSGIIRQRHCCSSSHARIARVYRICFEESCAETPGQTGRP